MKQHQTKQADSGVFEAGSRRHYAFRETLTDPDEIRNVARLLVERSALATARADGRVVCLQAEGQDACGDLVFGVVGEPPRPPCVITATGYNALYRIPVRSMRVEHERMWVALPPSIERVRSRRSRRVEVGQGLRVTFDHPLHPERRIERPVLDLTHNGLSFTADASCGLLDSGLAIPFMLVERPNGQVIALRARIENRRDCDGRGTTAYGCSIETQSARDAERWRAACDELLFPHTRRGAAEVWSVYRDSGYFGLSDTLDGFDHLRPAYNEASRALASAPHLGCQASWPARGPAVATVTNLRLYPSCWFSYHLAVAPEQTIAVRAQEVLRELYRQYIEHCLSLPGPRWQMAYVQHSAHWSKRVHVDLPQRYQATGAALIHDFRALQLRSVGAQRRTRSSGIVRVGAPELITSIATDAQLEEALRTLHTLRSPIYCDALEYTADPERFRLLELKREWARHGMERDRDLIVATEGDTIIAVGVVETAQAGLHLFGLLDTLRMYALQPYGERAFDDVLDAARAWFRQRNRRSFCYLEEEGDLVADGVDVKEMSRAMMTLLSVDRLPEMLEHLHSETAKAPEARSSTRHAADSAHTSLAS